MSDALTPTTMPDEQRARFQDRSYLILAVHDASPAAALGLTAGWAILSMGRAELTEERIERAQLNREQNVFLLADPDGQTYRTEPSLWPFGLVTAPWPGASLKRQIARGHCDLEELTRYWKQGALSVYPSLIRSLETYLSQPFVGFFKRLQGKIAAPDQLAQNDNYSVLSFLALAYAVDRNLQKAEFFLAATRDARVRAQQASYSTIDSSLDAYTESLISEQKGETARALEMAQKAKGFSSDIWEVERRLAELETRAPVSETPTWVGETFPINYQLPAHDPLGEIRNNVPDVRFDEVIKSLNPGEFLVVLVLGGYRSNYYYNLDLVRLAILRKAFPGTIREVHAITSGTYALDANHRKYCEGFARDNELPFAILWDEDDQVAAAVMPTGSPERFLVDSRGTVHATERLMEEEGYWKAIARIRA